MSWFKKKTISKQQAEQEISKIIKRYKEEYDYPTGFLVGSSLCGYKQGDSARYCELKKIIDNPNF